MVTVVRNPYELPLIMSSPYWKRRIINGMIGNHKGLDLSVPEGTPLYPIADGDVIATGTRDDWGNWILIQHDQNFSTLYAHLSKLPLKKARDKVSRNEVIGFTGNTGRSTSPHLHMELFIVPEGKKLERTSQSEEEPPMSTSSIHSLLFLDRYLTKRVMRSYWNLKYPQLPIGLPL